MRLQPVLQGQLSMMWCALLGTQVVQFRVVARPGVLVTGQVLLLGRVLLPGRVLRLEPAVMLVWVLLQALVRE